MSVEEITKNELSADDVLKEAIGVYERVLIIGYNKKDTLDPRASLNVDDKEAILMMEIAKSLLTSRYIK